MNTLDKIARLLSLVGAALLLAAVFFLWLVGVMKDHLDADPGLEQE